MRGPKSAFELREGMKGILVSCPRGMERRCLAEFLEIIERSNSSLEEATNPGEVHISFSSSLKNEVNSVAKAAKSSYIPVKLGKLNCLVFIKTKANDPCRMVDDMFSTENQAAGLTSRFCLRTIPILNVCSTHLEDICKAVRPIVAQYFTDSSLSYSILIESRYCSGLRKNILFEALTDIIGSRYRLNNDAPDIVLTIQAFYNVCGIGILYNYRQRKKYNLQEFLNSK